MQTRGAARLARVAVPSVGSRVFAKAIGVSAAELERLRAVACSGLPIFNPDSMRVQQDVDPSDDVVRRLVDFLRDKRLTEGRVVGPAVAIHSHAGCQRQPMHTDYDPHCVGRCASKPLGVLVALQDGARVSLPDGDVALDAGDVFVFDGDVVHAGAAYDEANTRIHMYLDLPGVQRPHNMTYLVR